VGTWNSLSGARREAVHSSLSSAEKMLGGRCYAPRSPLEIGMSHFLTRQHEPYGFLTRSTN